MPDYTIVLRCSKCGQMVLFNFMVKWSCSLKYALECFFCFLSGYTKFMCNKSITANLGDNTSITCKNNKNITCVVMTLPLQIHLSICPGLHYPTTTVDGRISLKMNKSSSVILRINNVQISDKGVYVFYLHSASYGFTELNTSVKVVGKFEPIGNGHHEGLRFDFTWVEGAKVL